ncbi:hypothetical protein FLL93_19630 [Vibrio cholerae]|uniref:lasso peptide biosynthesis protein n=1 Tax=Vibrio cholerae TaxID=666 RepID=UPI0011579040|nr:lasso peptide biosynthesis protein [Vibrio cholerae]TQP27684.1 hypothetical protein FLL93_19630 [Vibrio cholerae]
MKTLIQKADRLFEETPDIYKIKKVFFGMLDYLHKNDWQGACHASSSIMYLILREQGVDIQLYLGEVKRGDIVFDHSWLEYHGQPIDAAISNTNIRGFSFPPVFLGYDLTHSNVEKTSSNYSFVEGEGLDPEMLFHSKNSFGQYLDGFSGNPNGLWGVAKNFSKTIGYKFNIAKAKSSYSNDRWQLKS